jgi:hypothetical protein
LAEQNYARERHWILKRLGHLENAAAGQVRGASRIMRMASWMWYFTGFSSPVRVRKKEK